MFKTSIVSDAVLVLNGLLKVTRSSAVIHRSSVGTILRKSNVKKALENVSSAFKNIKPSDVNTTIRRASMIHFGIRQFVSIAPKYTSPSKVLSSSSLFKRTRTVQSIPLIPIHHYYQSQELTTVAKKFSTTTISKGTTASPAPLPTDPTPPPLPSSKKKSSRENIWTIPNALCIMRIGMAPVAAYMILNSQFGPALGIFAVAGVTDLLDGYIARVVPGQATVMGSFLDPMADKILVGTLFLSLTYMDLIPVPLTGLIIGRDAILIMSGFYIRYKSLDLPDRTFSRYWDITYPTAQLAPTVLSKINTGVQLGLVGATMVSAVLPYDVHTYLEFLWYFTATTTVASAVGYLFAKDTVKLLRKRVTKSSHSKDKDK